ncbi:hypothetical protein EAW52_10990 [Pseudomonas sp. LTJR-52]|uniref:HK97 family phage prohead protease n=1 Tax=Pseudomonas sp. LTJR-52 TaxID=2479392 RepID=UPI000EFAA6B8|nr:HK97 family phage prohead protease [Pseudomonas sp. LTJR-52]AYN94447.1 hypothetical protein EAW52_10990 [Pseudomonas sp. LTJR-52]
MKLQCKLPLQVKSVAEQGQFEGIASAYNLADPDRDVILPGAFSDSLAAHQAHGTMPALLWQHKADEPIGNWLAFEDTPEGLLARGNLAMSIARARDEAYPLLKSGALSLSIGSPQILSIHLLS